MVRWLPRFAALALVVGLLMSPAVQVAASEDDGGLSGVRDATEKFHDVNRAVAANYVSFLPCFDQPGVGGMGQHYVNLSLLDTTLQPTKPEALVYEVNGSRLRLVAVEYLVPISAWGSSTPPHLFGRAFFRNDTLGVWYLHAWIWRHNPIGTFANYNPKVKLCPGH